MIAIIDYGVGNLFSLVSSFKKIGVDAVITSEKKVIEQADKIILPGVGAFEDASKKLFNSGLGQVVIEQAKQGKPLMGICLGMQMLFDKSYEYGEHKGLGLIKGEVRALKERLNDSYRIPHIGWNALKFTNPKNAIFKYLEDGDCVYFVHSYYATNCTESVIATTEYGFDVTGAVASGNVYGCQFHPEKSGEVGLKILKEFSELE
jgi:glutamine amidotransferase